MLKQFVILFFGQNQMKCLNIFYSVLESLGFMTAIHNLALSN